MKVCKSIYISHNRAQATEAKELAKYLLQLRGCFDLSIGFLENFDVGSHIEEEVERWITSADLIIVLLSVDYLNENDCELLKIEKSNCLSNRKVIPIEVKSCLWEKTFLGELKSFPKLYSQKDASWDEAEKWNNVVNAVESILKRQPHVSATDVEQIKARANSKSFIGDFKPSKRVKILNKLHSQEVAVKVEGDSMQPYFRDGDEIVARRIDGAELIRNYKKEVFVFVTHTMGCLLKSIEKIEEESIVLSSSNPLHKNFSLALHEIEEVFMVLKNRRL